MAFRGASRQFARSLRSAQFRPLHRSFASEASSSSSTASPSSSHAVLGGLAGGTFVFIVGYGYYHFSGAKSAMNSLHQARQYYDTATQKIQEQAPEPNEAIKWLRDVASSYAAFIPGAKHYVDAAMNDLEAVHQKHGEEVDKIVKNTYQELKQVSKDEGANLQAAYNAWAVLERAIRDVTKLAGDATDEILDNHPHLKEQVGGNINELKRMAKTYGPQAQEQLDKTWDQIRSIISKGVSKDSVDEVKQLLQEKKGLLKRVGEEGYEKAVNEAKPYLDKAPQVKELVEKNADALKQADSSQLAQLIRNAVDSGSIQPLKDFVENANK